MAQKFRFWLRWRVDLILDAQVPETATKAEIKTAYRLLAKQCHPDVSRASTSNLRFKAISEAYAVLSNERLRRRYDEIGRSPSSGGARGRRRPAEDGGDVMAVLWLDLVEAAMGVERPLKVSVAVTCPDCEGVAGLGASSGTCLLCRGSGETRRRASRAGLLGCLAACPMCGGKGSGVQQWCRSCGSRGLAKVVRTLRVRVPPGVDHKSVLRLRGRGNEGRFGGSAGDVYVSFIIRSRPDMVRRGKDLISQLNVAYTDAILGSVYEVSTLWGAARLPIPPGTQHGSVLELRDGGIGGNADAGARGSAGSHLYKVAIRLPLMLGDEEKRLLERLVALQRAQRESL